VVAVGVDPGVDLFGVEAEEVSPLDGGDALLVDEAAYVADVDAELRGDVTDATSWPCAGGVAMGMGGSSSWWCGCSGRPR
jgi:hypothetical protein